MSSYQKLFDEFVISDRLSEMSGDLNDRIRRLTDFSTPKSTTEIVDQMVNHVGFQPLVIEWNDMKTGEEGMYEKVTSSEVTRVVNFYVPYVGDPELIYAQGSRRTRISLTLGDNPTSKTGEKRFVITHHDPKMDKDSATEYIRRVQSTIDSNLAAIAQDILSWETGIKPSLYCLFDARKAERERFDQAKKEFFINL